MTHCSPLHQLVKSIRTRNTALSLLGIGSIPMFAVLHSTSRFKSSTRSPVMNTWTCWTETNHDKLVHYISSKLRAAAGPLHEHHSPNISEVWVSAVLGAVVLWKVPSALWAGKSFLCHPVPTKTRQRSSKERPWLKSGPEHWTQFTQLKVHQPHHAASCCFMLSGKNPVIMDRKPHISYTWQQRGGRGWFKQQEASTRSTIMESWGGKVLRP